MGSVKMGSVLFLALSQVYFNESKIELTPFFYFYVGWALQGLEARIERHLKRNKRNFWHIDYLLDYSEILGIIYLIISSGDAECRIASNLEKSFKSVKNFGSSDCTCKSHLFFKPI